MLRQLVLAISVYQASADKAAEELNRRGDGRPQRS